jgi:hypothetical protein
MESTIEFFGSMFHVIVDGIIFGSFRAYEEAREYARVLGEEKQA